MELGFLRKGTWKRILRKLGYAMKHKHKNVFAYVCIVQCASWRNKNVGFLLISKNNSKIQCKKKKIVNPFSKIKPILSMKNRTKMTSFDFGGTIGFLGSKIGAKKFPNSKKNNSSLHKINYILDMRSILALAKRKERKRKQIE